MITLAVPIPKPGTVLTGGSSVQSAAKTFLKQRLAVALAIFQFIARLRTNQRLLWWSKLALKDRPTVAQRQAQVPRRLPRDLVHGFIKFLHPAFAFEHFARPR